MRQAPRLLEATLIRVGGIPRRPRAARRSLALCQPLTAWGGNVFYEMETTRAERAKQLNAFFAQYADPKYDIWKGGGSKAKRHTE